MNEAPRLTVRLPLRATVRAPDGTRHELEADSLEGLALQAPDVEGGWTALVYDADGDDVATIWQCEDDGGIEWRRANTTRTVP